MGLDIQNAKFLSLCKSMGVDYSKILTFGRQQIVIDDISKICSSKNEDLVNTIKKDKYADNFFIFLGANKIDVTDTSNYEGANIIFDLNEPPPSYLESSYSCVIDLGTLEHVFHYSRALQTAMSCVAESGHIIIATPTNNLMGHGFYQLSPELFLRAFTEENGFEVIRMILADQFEESPWYEINLAHRPTELAKRYIAPSNWAPTYLMVLARRKSIKPLFTNPPQQMAYVSMWNNINGAPGLSATFANSRSISKSRKLTGFIKKGPLIRVYRRLRSALQGHKLPEYYSVIPSQEWMNY